MKIKVRKEGRKGMWLVEKKEIKKYIKSKKFKEVHCFIEAGFFVMGADHSLKSVLKDIDNSEKNAILTGAAQQKNLGHALAVVTDKLNMFDIGKITEGDLICI